MFNVPGIQREILAAIATDDLWGDITDWAGSIVGKPIANGIDWVGRKVGKWLGFSGTPVDVSQHIT